MVDCEQGSEFLQSIHNINIYEYFSIHDDVDKYAFLRILSESNYCKNILIE